MISRIRELELEPLDAVSEPLFDLAWRVGETLFICEVKTLGPSGDKQLRLGLGQILHYAAMLKPTMVSVEPCLLVEHEPVLIWLRLCEAHGVRVFSPDTWEGFAEMLLLHRDGR